MLDRLPAWARHAVLVLVAAASVPVTAAVFAANGVLGVDWARTGGQALDAAGVAAAILVALWATPLTRQYGRGSVPGARPPLPEPTDVDPADPEPEVEPEVEP